MSEKKLRWDLDKGIINLVRDDKEERVMLVRADYMSPFMQEIKNTGGEHMVQTVIRAYLKKISAKENISASDLPSINTLYDSYNDGYFLPLAVENLPKELTWDGKSRNFQVFGGTLFTVSNLSLLLQFKEVIAEVMTERGAVAILHNVSKKSGSSVWDAVKKDYKWDDLEKAIATIDAFLNHVFPIYGWGKTRCAIGVGQDGNYLAFIKCDNAYETHNVSSKVPVCVLQRSYLEGLAESLISEFTGKSVESREVTCLAKGDDFCGYAIKAKEKGEKALDWKELEGEWMEVVKKIL